MPAVLPEGFRAPISARPASYEVPTSADMASITRQLGRPPRGTLGIVRRSRCGFPQVVLTAPLFVYPAKRDDDEDPSSLSVEVFPTQFWLTCPLLREAIGRLESVGYIERAERRLQDDPEFRRQMAESHRAAAAFRVGLVPPEWRTRKKKKEK